MSIENPTLAHFRHFSSLFTKFPSTSVENPLQINPFYAKQTQFPKSQMNVSIFSTKAYENKSNWTLGENKPNSNPIKPNLKRTKMNVNSFITKDYRKKDAFAVRKNKPNSKPISSKPKMNANVFSQKDYENVTAFRPKKTNPNKPNFTYPQRGKTEVRCRMSDVRYLSSVFCLLSMGTWVAIGKPNRNCQMNSLRKVVEKC